MIWLIALGCLDSNNLGTDFDAPVGVAVLPPAQGGPFQDPVAFVSNQEGGTLLPLDVQHGWVVPEDAAAPYIESPHIPTGADRVLGAVAAYAPDDQTVTLLVADAGTGTLLEVPWVIAAEEGRLSTQRARLVAEPSFQDVDSSGDSATLEIVGLRRGRATTETWTLTYTGQDFLVQGSRSGQQYRHATWLTPYASDDGALDLMIEGSATEGDTFVFEVDSGVVEHDLGGQVQDLLMLADQSALFALVATLPDPALSEQQAQTRLLALDPQTMTVSAEVALPAGAWPYRISADLEQQRLFLSDAQLPQVLQIDLVSGDLASSTVTALPMPATVVDIAFQGDQDYEHLFVALRGENVVRLYDLLKEEWVDVNPVTAEIDGVYLGAPVSGMAASSDPILLQQQGEWQARERDRVVSISTAEGVVMVAQGSNGCLAMDSDGPVVSFGDRSGDTGFADNGTQSNPSFEVDDLGNAVQVNPCGGIARSESWSLIYDGAQGNWVLEGSVSGFQERRVLEDERYVSDSGALSFQLISGNLPSTDGDQWSFSVRSGAFKIDYDRNQNNTFDNGEAPIENPGRPVSYSFLAGAEEGGWVPVNRKVGVILPVTGYDNVCKVDLQAGRITTIWD